MDNNANYELYQIRQELKKIIDELDTVSNGVRKDFDGIGNDVCATAITKAANNYRSLKKQLDKINIDVKEQEKATEPAETPDHNAGGSSDKNKSGNSGGSSDNKKEDSSNKKKPDNKGGLIGFLEDLFG